MTPFSLSTPTATATSAFHALATGGNGTGDGDGDGSDPPTYQDRAKGQRDLYTQIVISCILGLSAFLTFCVSVPCTFEAGMAVAGGSQRELTNLWHGLGIAAEMESALCGKEEAAKRRDETAGVAGYHVRMDPVAIQNH